MILIQYKFLKAGVLLLLLNGCSSLAGVATDAVVGQITGQKSGLSVDTEIVAGDKTQALNSDSVDSSTKVEDITADAVTLSNSTHKQKNTITAEALDYSEGVPYWQVGLSGFVWFLAGLFLPQYAVGKKNDTKANCDK